MKKLYKPNLDKNGFTLIEIIAVLVILGMLSVVAISKYIDLQNEACYKGIEAAVGSGIAELYMQYAHDLLSGDHMSSGGVWSYTSPAGHMIGDYQVSLSGQCQPGSSPSNQLIITVQDAPSSCRSALNDPGYAGKVKQLTDWCH
ncbi:MAG: type II secretion system protein [Deltaproteobacteria bacterium]|nr:type II secretion system protein [Deltaproteobacteria bacterium]